MTFSACFNQSAKNTENLGEAVPTEFSFQSLPCLMGKVIFILLYLGHLHNNRLLSACILSSWKYPVLSRTYD